MHTFPYPHTHTTKGEEFSVSNQTNLPKDAHSISLKNASTKNEEKATLKSVTTSFGPPSHPGIGVLSSLGAPPRPHTELKPGLGDLGVGAGVKSFRSDLIESKCSAFW